MSGKQLIQVPKYFAEFFSRKLFVEEQAIKRKMAALKRINFLINCALEDLPDVDWYIVETKYHGSLIHRPYGIEFDETMTYVFLEKQSTRFPIAIFKDSHLAADYFVYLVSEGRREINWDLYV